MEKDGKTCFNAEKMILTSKRHAKHPFTGQNTQQLYNFQYSTSFYILKPMLCSIVIITYKAQKRVFGCQHQK